jgi:predicted adenine nucleotide alpha hydrolase (AANH) superfamily ATPase
MQENYKTFKDMNVEFSEGSGCHTCYDNSCHNTVPKKPDGEEYNVHISTNPDRTLFRIYASTQTNSSTTDDISEEFQKEEDAVKFICQNFEWFKCF